MTGLALYTSTARRSSARVIGAYSTSFGLASRLLPRRVRQAIADIYALVRVADEIVDGPAAEAGADQVSRLAMLNALQAETLSAMRDGFSANLVVHAFAATANEALIEPELVVAFFDSMRVDIDPPASFDDAAYLSYIHGSAEVVGTMCLRAFMLERGPLGLQHPIVEEGARRLGSAFQQVNFLRDLADDCDRLGRSYLPGVDPAAFTDQDRDRIVAEIRDDLAAARRALPRLPRGARRATAAATGLFAALCDLLARTPAEVIRHRRVSVPSSTKARILASAMFAGGSR